VHKVHVQGTIAPKKRGRLAQGPVGYKERYEILKKYQTFLEGGRSREKSFHHERATTSSLSVLCDVLEIAPSTYYKYRHQLDPDLPMYRLIRHRFDQSKQTYGYRRMTMAMRQQEGLLINEKKIRLMMRKFHLKPRCLRRFRYHSDTRNRMATNIQPDGLRRQFNQAGGVIDITYLIRQLKEILSPSLFLIIMT